MIEHARHRASVFNPEAQVIREELAYSVMSGKAGLEPVCWVGDCHSVLEAETEEVGLALVSVGEID
jgi:hypothetical protein